MPAVSYPGTVTPLRGLTPFAESERDVLFGRDREREELSRLVTGEGYRAGLLYGEPGVGKTSLLRAGLVPHLRDHGVVALYCEDVFQPILAFARGLAAATGLSPREGEQDISFLSRVAGEAMAGQVFLFIVDESELVLRDERVVGELGDLFARVVARSGGRARFLFGCATGRVHLFGQLERRTGSLFPPSSRYQLERFEPAEAAGVLERTLALAGVEHAPELPKEIAHVLGQSGPALPADVQIAALAVRELGIRDHASLQRAGGAGELERAWLARAAASTGNERSALRLLAELDSRDGPIPVAADWAAARANVDPAFAHAALSVLQEKGVTRAVPVRGNEEFHWVLSHEILGPRVREVAAPARAAARRAFELLGSKAQQRRRLGWREWLEVRREGITPATPEERLVLERTKRIALIVAGVAAAAPLFLLIVIYVSLAGQFYLDVESAAGGDRVVVRKGRPGLSAFFWLPASPSFGSKIADTGFTRSMIGDESWEQIGDHDVVGDEGGYADRAVAALRPRFRGLVEYASDGSETALEAMRQEATEPGALASLLQALAPIARGGPQEVALVEEALASDSPAVQRTALGLAAAAAQRRPGVYDDTLAQALTSSDHELRRLAFSAVRALGQETSQELFKEALASGPDERARRELLAVVAGGPSATEASASSATSILANKEISKATREKARALLERAFVASPEEATMEAAKLLREGKAPAEDQVLALELLREHTAEALYSQVVSDIRGLLSAKSEDVRAAALPLYAKLTPKDAAGDLAVMLDNTGLSTKLRVAMALAWGEVAKAGNKTAEPALVKLLEDSSSAVQAAAARAYGNLGRRSQGDLVKMVKKERFDVAVGAAYGLANAAAAGGSAGLSVGGIRDLWKRKGRARRAAAQVFARMARHSPGRAYTYLNASARSNDDPRLHSIGVEGLCNAMAAGHKGARFALARAADNDSVAVRRLVIQCVVDNPGFTAAAIRVAREMVNDPDSQIRAEVTRVLAKVASGEEIPEEVKAPLVTLAKDDDRGVRILAIEALARLGSAATDAAREVLGQIFDQADETEKLVILETAQAIGAEQLVQLGISDGSPLVRVAALDTAIATGSAVASTLSSALTDPDAGLRRAALKRLSAGEHGLGGEQVQQALSLAIRDQDPSISSLALTALARLGDPSQIVPRLSRELGARSERERARAAAACLGLAQRAPDQAIELLEPLLEDPSHDVRAAMLPALATAYAAVLSPDKLSGRLNGAEMQATERLVVAAAFYLLARTDEQKEAASAALEKLAESARPLAKQTARLTRGLIAADADALEFLAFLVP